MTLSEQCFREMMLISEERNVEVRKIRARSCWVNMAAAEEAIRIKRRHSAPRCVASETELNRDLRKRERRSRIMHSMRANHGR